LLRIGEFIEYFFSKSLKIFALFAHLQLKISGREIIEGNQGRVNEELIVNLADRPDI